VLEILVLNIMLAAKNGEHYHKQPTVGSTTHFRINFRNSGLLYRNRLGLTGSSAVRSLPQLSVMVSPFGHSV
jgi:hypothetical protein